MKKTKEQQMEEILNSLNLKYLSDINIPIGFGMVKIDYLFIDTIGIYVLNFRDFESSTPGIVTHRTSQNISDALHILLSSKFNIIPKYVGVATNKKDTGATELGVVCYIKNLKKQLQKYKRTGTDILTELEVESIYNYLNSSVKGGFNDGYNDR